MTDQPSTAQTTDRDANGGRTDVGDDDEPMRAERGAAALVALPDQHPAVPSVDAVLSEVPAQLGVTFVSPIFKALAHWPGFFVGAWRAYAPLIDTDEYRAALTRLAVPRELLPPTDPGLMGHTADVESLRHQLRAQQALLPELLLLASAWYRSACGHGRAPRGTSGSASPRGVPSTSGSSAPSSSASNDPEVEAVYRHITELHGHPRVLSVYRNIGRWPGFLVSAAPVLYDRIRDPLYQQARLALLDGAMKAAGTLPMPATTAPDAEGAAEILALFRTRLIPTLILDTAVLLALVDAGFPTH